jgi:hypothetical protein
MAKKQFFLIVDTETTVSDTVYDFGALVVDRQGNIYASCAVIVAESKDLELFFDPTAARGGLWSRQYAAEKKAKYSTMLESGARMVASVNAVNRWLEKVKAKYDPMLTAYNVAFDRSKCGNTNIDLAIFTQSFCLWHLACETYAKTKAYRQFVLENHNFGARTQYGNMTYKTNAEVMAHFVTGVYSDEPHTALEDAQFYELPILVAILKKKNWKEKIGVAYNWRDYQLKDAFVAK